MSRAREFSIVAVSLLSSATPALAQCEWQWRNFDADASSTVRTFFPWDVDHDGVSELFVGGSFSEIGGVSASGLAVWDGVGFSAFPDPPFQSVDDLVEFRGALYCVGNSALYHWNGTEWDYVESAPFPIDGLHVHADNLIVHGAFTRCIKRWDGTAWYDYGLGMSDGYLGDAPSVDAVAIYNGELYAGGNFNEADGRCCTTVVRWDGTTWQSLPDGPEPKTKVLAVFDGKLYAGGLSRLPWYQPLSYWDGSSWTFVNGLEGFDADVFALAEFDGTLVLGGAFEGPHELIAFWDGQSFSGLGRGIDGVAVFALAEFNGDLYAGGWFDEIDRLPIESFGIWTYAPDGDANGDLKVDLSDLGIVLRSFSTCNGNPLFDHAAGRLGDNGNTCVDLEDLNEVLTSWGATCE